MKARCEKKESDYNAAGWIGHRSANAEGATRWTMQSICKIWTVNKK